MSLGLELAKQHAEVMSLQDKLKEAGGYDLQSLKDKLLLTKQKIKKLENKIKNTRPYYR